MLENHDSNSLWTIKEGQDLPMKTYADMVLCGDKIRLEHALTKKNLHSHDEKAPISGKSEVSAYGNDGDGDEGNK